MTATDPNQEALLTLLQGLVAIPDIIKRIEKLEVEIARLKRPKEPNKWLSLKESAEILNMSQVSVRRLIHRKLLRRNEATRHIRIPREDVESLVNRVTF